MSLHRLIRKNHARRCRIPFFRSSGSLSQRAHCKVRSRLTQCCSGRRQEERCSGVRSTFGITPSPAASRNLGKNEMSLLALPNGSKRSSLLLRSEFFVSGQSRYAGGRLFASTNRAQDFANPGIAAGNSSSPSRRGLPPREICLRSGRHRGVGARATALTWTSRA